MKKLLYVFSAGLVLLFSCNKPQPAVEMITRTVEIAPEIWNDEESKTAYEPGTGIVWTGNELPTIFYGNGALPVTEKDTWAGTVTSITKVSDKTYSFSHPAISGAASYKYAVLMPAVTNAAALNSTKNGISFKFSPVQMPGANTFDPNYDLLLGQMQVVDEAQTSLVVDKFKRMFTPLLVKVTNVPDNEKIYAVNVAFESSDTKRDWPNALSGIFYFQPSEEYDATKFSGGNAGNGVTAIYAQGAGLQEHANGYYPVWLMVKPAKFASGVNLKMTVVTATKTYTKAVALTSAMEFKADKFNSFGADLSGSGWTVAPSVYQCFSGQTGWSSPKKLNASDGISYTWTTENCILGNNTDPILPNCLRSNSAKGTITLPTIADKKIVRIRLYQNTQNSNNALNQFYLDGDSDMKYSFQSYQKGWDPKNSILNTLAEAGGVLEIPVPEGLQSNPIKLVSTNTSSAHFWITAISFDYE